MKRLEISLHFLILGMLVACFIIDKSEALHICSYNVEQDRKILLKKSELIKEHEFSFAKKILERMHEFLKINNGGVSIAAPQIGVLKRLIVIDLTPVPRFQNSKPMLMVNPVITKREGLSYSVEGCISVDRYGVFERSSKVDVEFIDLNGVKHCSTLFGLEAFCCQHEIDHLDGILISSKCSIVGLKDPIVLMEELTLTDMDIRIKDDLRLYELALKYRNKY